jgi:hypothetical protein
MNLKQALIHDGFAIVPNFINQDRALALFNIYKKEKFLENKTDPQVIGPAHSVINFRPFLEVLCEKIPQVSNIIGGFVFPTYTFARIYKNGQVLKPHTDRPACEISLSVHLYGDKEWPIYMQKPDGVQVPVVLSSGDAVIYLGCDTPHWRNAYDGEEYGQFFLHYVLSTGENWGEFFNLNYFFGNIIKKVEA